MALFICFLTGSSWSGPLLKLIDTKADKGIPCIKMVPIFEQLRGHPLYIESYFINIEAGSTVTGGKKTTSFLRRQYPHRDQLSG